MIVQFGRRLLQNNMEDLSMASKSQMSARDRIASLLDENSFVEVGAAVTKRNTDFNATETAAPSDGVITGYGVIEGNPVFVYSQDASVLGGSIGEMHATKIARIYDLATKTGAPVVGLVDCSGLRLEEATDALAAFGFVFKKEVRASGIVPQITAVFGNCGGGSAVLAALSDVVVMEKENAKLFVNNPNTIDDNSVEKCDTSSAAYMAANGQVDIVAEDELDVLTNVRKLVAVLPQCNEEDPSIAEEGQDLNRSLDNLDAELKDTALAIADIADPGSVIELKKEYGKDVVTALIKLNGVTTGAIANRRAILDENGKTVTKFDGRMSKDACEKVADFVKLCDAFNIPVFTLVDVEGFEAKKCSEAGLAKSVAEMAYAFADATVPKISIVAGKAYGTAYIAFNSKHIGADLVFAYDDAKIGTMDSKLAAQILYADELKNDGDGSLTAKKAAEYEEKSESAASAAKRGYVDDVIEKAATRQHLIYAFEMLYSKRETRIAKKHGTV